MMMVIIKPGAIGRLLSPGRHPTNGGPGRPLAANPPPGRRARGRRGARCACGSRGRPRGRLIAIINRSYDRLTMMIMMTTMMTMMMMMLVMLMVMLMMMLTTMMMMLLVMLMMMLMAMMANLGPNGATNGLQVGCK